MTEDLKITAAPTDATVASNSGCACCAPSAATSEPASSASSEDVIVVPQGSTKPVTQAYDIAGMTCGHCVGAVTDELRALSSVSDVHIDLGAGGTSTAVITSTSAVPAADAAAAGDEAGYQLIGRSA